MTDVKSLFKNLKATFPNHNGCNKVSTTNLLFRLHTKLTSTLLIISSALIFIQQFMNEHIRCLLPPEDDVRPSALNQYCFIMGTYTVPHLYESSLDNSNGRYNLTSNSAHLGVGTYLKGQGSQKFHHYFQWVPFVLLLQGLFFHIPANIWKSLEAGRLNSYCNFEIGENLNLFKSKKLDRNGVPERLIVVQNVGTYFVRNLGYNKSYAMGFFFCEFLNFLAVVLSFSATDWFLSGDFQNYGLEWMRFRSRGGVSPMDRIFPKVSKCDFQKFGPSGGIIKYDLICILALNIINEKVYLILWFWLWTLFILGGLGFIYRVWLLVFPTSRGSLMFNRAGGNKNVKDNLKKVLKRLSYADWFLLERIQDNIDRFCFGDLAIAILTALGGKDTQERSDRREKDRHGSERQENDRHESGRHKNVDRDDKEISPLMNESPQDRINLIDNQNPSHLPKIDEVDGGVDVNYVPLYEVTVHSNEYLRRR